MSFQECLMECCSNQELVKQFNRLTGRKVLDNIYDKRASIIKMVDESTGYQKELDKKANEDMQFFISFVFEFIWLPVQSLNEEFKWPVYS